MRTVAVEKCDCFILSSLFFAVLTRKTAIDQGSRSSRPRWPSPWPSIPGKLWLWSPPHTHGEDDDGGRARVTTDEERVLRGRWTHVRWWWYGWFSITQSRSYSNANVIGQSSRKVSLFRLWMHVQCDVLLVPCQVHWVEVVGATSSKNFLVLVGSGPSVLQKFMYSSLNAIRLPYTLDN